MKNIATIFQSLADETRLRIMSLLLDQEELCVCYLVDVLNLPQSTVSRQLGLLKKSGWLKDRREGLWNYYSINRSLKPIQQFLLPMLQNFLATTETAIKDQERLAVVLKENRYK
jgi:ArsR family transcriptional regulator